MPLEATILCLDNSEYSRNGDFTPSRWESQKDAANLILDIKTRENPENSIGIVKVGPKPEVLATPSQDQGKLLAVIQSIKIGGSSNNFVTSLSIAFLSLKNRSNRNQKMRIISFVGSPIVESDESMIQLAKKLKKNNVAVDIISFGDTDRNARILEEFLAKVKKQENSHLIQIPATVPVLVDTLLQSQLFNLAQEQIQQFQEFGGVNPELDPELAMAMRISMEEAKAAEQQQQNKVEQPKPQEQVQQQMKQEEEVKQAIQLAQQNPVEEVQMTEEETLKKAMEMSMEAAVDPQIKYQEVFNDTDFVQNLLSGLQGVDANDPSIQQTLADLRGDKQLQEQTQEKEENKMQEEKVEQQEKKENQENQESQGNKEQQP